MKLKKKKIEAALKQLNQLITKIENSEKEYKKIIDDVHPNNRKSALNLLHYLALRNNDLKELQNVLGQVGISRLGRAESHVQASVLMVRNLLVRLHNQEELISEKCEVSIKKGRKLLKANTRTLFGKKLKGSKIRIMVTLPTEAAFDYKFVEKLIKSGMNCARINCAHDKPEVWLKMIANVKKARKLTGRNCKIAMDLAGPKLRTGSIVQGPKVIHLSPERDVLGKIISPAKALLVDNFPVSPAKDTLYIPIPSKSLKTISAGDVFQFTDARGKNCKLNINRVNKHLEAVCYDSAYIQTGTELCLKKENSDSVTSVIVGELPPVEGKIKLNKGDKIILNRKDILGESTLLDEKSQVKREAHISCTLPEIFMDLMEGEPILFDDGKIEGKVEKINNDNAEILITYAKEGGSFLQADKGINLPDSNLSITGLTDKDKEDLSFVCSNADIANISFVNSKEDVEVVLSELKKNNNKDVGIILKIETKSAFKNLPAILLKAMQYDKVGVMIARGDLAIECGWKALARMQEEILWLCEAAHVPIVYATQVMETLAKKGLPSRAEITDAAMAEKAECVMLNKGPYIFEAIKMIEEIMYSLEEYYYKKTPLLPLMKTIQLFTGEETISKTNVS